MESLVHGMLSNAAAVAVLAVLVAIAGRICRRPALIHSVCLLAMLKLVTPPVVSLPVPVPCRRRAWPAPADPAGAGHGRRAGPRRDGRGAGREMPPIPEDPRRVAILAGAARRIRHPRGTRPRRHPGDWSWESVALGVVLAGALAWWTLAAVRIVRFHRLLRDVEPMPAEWQAEIDELAGRLGLRRPPTACLVPGDVPPMLWAVGAARPAAGAGAAVGDARRRRADVAPPARAGPPEAPRSLGALGRAGGRRAVLVASGRLVDPPRVARGRGAVLRRLGRLGDASRGQDLCRRARGGPRIRLG